MAATRSNTHKATVSDDCLRHYQLGPQHAASQRPTGPDGRHLLRVAVYHVWVTAANNAVHMLFATPHGRYSQLRANMHKPTVIEAICKHFSYTLISQHVAALLNCIICM